jgi:hypothetical protein
MKDKISLMLAILRPEINRYDEKRTIDVTAGTNGLSQD